MSSGANVARSDGPDPAAPAIRDSQAFQAEELLAAGERFAELMPDVPPGLTDVDMLELEDIEERWECVDCGIPLEPGSPPICSECVDG